MPPSCDQVLLSPSPVSCHHIKKQKKTRTQKIPLFLHCAALLYHILFSFLVSFFRYCCYCCFCPSASSPPPRQWTVVIKSVKFSTLSRFSGTFGTKPQTPEDVHQSFPTASVVAHDDDDYDCPLICSAQTKAMHSMLAVQVGK